MNQSRLRCLARASLVAFAALSLRAEVAITGTQLVPPGSLRLLFTDTTSSGTREVQFSPLLSPNPSWEPVPGVTINAMPAGGYEALVPGATGARGFYRIISQGSATDPDGDGLSTAEELQGWTVVAKKADGTSPESRVFSNPNLADTDGDGLNDKEEQSKGLDPNLIDTDGDGLSDFNEVRVFHTNPASVDSDQDADGDTRFLDLAEVLNGTSPNLTDTDGDQIRDKAEVQGGRNPLVSDLPRPVVEIDPDSVILTLDVTYSDQNSTTRAYTATLGQSASSSLSRSDATSTQTSIEASASITAGVEAEIGLPPGFTASLSATFGLTAGFVEQNTVTVDSSRSQESQRQEEKHEEDSATFGSETSSGTISLTLKVSNKGSVGFKVKNLTITALRRNPAAPDSPQPVGTLQVTGFNDSSVGADETTGTLKAEVNNVSAELMRALLRDPTQLVFGIGIFDILDDVGRNYAFLRDTNRPLTAQVTLDFGNSPVNNELGQVERYRVATNVRVDQDGFSEGVLLKDVLEKYLRTVTEPKGIPYTMGTNSLTGLHVLTSLRGVATDSTIRHFWVVAGSRPELVNGVNFDEIRLLPTDRLNLFFVTDEDGDKLNDREEFVYGTSDHSPDTDGDGLSDYDEIRVGWDVAVAVRPVRHVFPDPRFLDSDGDGLSDKDEKQKRTDPRMKDTDLDGFKDSEDTNPLVYTLVPPTVTMDPPVVDGPTVTVKGVGKGRPAVFNVTVDWGDGSPTKELQAPQGAPQFPYAFEHVFAAEGTFTITATVRDVNGQEARVTSDYILHAPTITMEPPQVDGTKVTVKGHGASLPGVLNVTVDWGDGSAASELSPSTAVTEFPYLSDHVYATAGTFAITATVRGVNGLTATATGSATTVAFPRAGLLGEYLFTAASLGDTSGNGKNGFADYNFGSGFLTPTRDKNDKKDSALHFDASANFSEDGRASVVVGNGTPNSGWEYQQDYTLSSWIRFDSTLQNNVPFIVAQDSSPGLLLVDQHLAFGLPFGASGSIRRTSQLPVFDSSFLPDGTWTHVAVTVSRTAGGVTFTLYRNGNQVDQQTRSDTAFVYPVGAIGRIGVWSANNNNNPTREYNFGGDIDSVRIYSRSLRPDEIIALANDHD